MQDVNWNALFAFWMVARHGSFSEAARVLPRGSAQSLHKRVRELERRQNLALKLLQSRGMKGIKLTEGGQRVYEFIDPFFRGMDGLISGIQAGDSGSLSVGISPFGADTFVFKAFRSFRRAFPQVKVTIRDGFSAAVVEMVLAGEVDVGICRVPDATAGLVLTGSLPVRCQLLVHSDRLPHGRFQSWEQVLENPLVLPCRGSALRENIEKLLARRQLRNKLWIAAEVANMQQVVEAVRSGIGVGLAAAVPPMGGRRGMHRLHAPEGLPPLTLGVVHKRRDHLPAYMRAFLHFAAGAFTPKTRSGVTPFPDTSCDLDKPVLLAAGSDSH